MKYFDKDQPHWSLSLEKKKTRPLETFFLAFACLLKVAAYYEAQFATAHRHFGELSC